MSIFGVISSGVAVLLAFVLGAFVESEFVVGFSLGLLFIGLPNLTLWALVLKGGRKFHISI